ncbi:MAG TPA: VTT domain-containing protein [Symbiobacteriaceae bacterium]|jgi:membrane protein DedA with SNARE-associated domain|nr:VTT domain-containing protein [Symbiobacteriaceae bacterium]
MLPPVSYGTIVTIVAAGIMEGTGIPWPGALILAGVAANLEYGHIPLITACFTAGYCVGSVAQYILGRMIGRVVLSWLPERHRKSVEQMIAKHGPAAVFWTRPFAAGNYISIPAGLMKMSLFRFLAYTILGIAPWCAAVALAGRFLGGELSGLTAMVDDWFVPAVIVCGAAFAAYKVFTIYRSRRRRPTAQEAS